jgi:DNA-binding NtrC family response regulator
MTLQTDFECLEAKDIITARKMILENELDLILLDIRLGKESGIEILKFLGQNGLSRPVICISGEASYGDAIEAYKLGAVDFLDKPLTQQKLLLAIRKCLTQHELKERQRTFMQTLSATPHRLIGETDLIRDLRQQIDSIAASDSKVLILGETGTGKEVVASAIHRTSKRSQQPFVVVDCGALPPSLMESALFGHKKGAFTGADQDQAGRLECADGGTLFLDEIGELSIEGQNRLLRFIEMGEFQRVGSTKVQKVDTRIMAATSRDIEKFVKESRFRSDLFFRLSVFTLRTPPLREIAADIPAIFAFHLAKFHAELGKPGQELTVGQKVILTTYPWPGNIRELRNLAERSAILGINKALANLGHSKAHGMKSQSAVEDYISLKDFRHQMESEYIRKVLKHTDGNVTQAAKILGIDRVSLHQKISTYGLKE